MKRSDFDLAMYRFFRHIQDQIEEQPYWMQYEFYHPEIDAHEFDLFTNAIGNKSDAARWHDLGERFHKSREEPKGAA
jgi:hypothetical protein